MIWVFAPKISKDLQMVPLTRKGVVERGGMCSIRAGGDGSSAQWWVARSKAVPVARGTRRTAGANPDPSTATAAVHAPLCALARRDADAGRHRDRTRQGCGSKGATHTSKDMKRSGVLKEAAKLVPPPTDDPYEYEAYRLWTLKQRGK